MTRSSYPSRMRHAWAAILACGFMLCAASAGSAAPAGAPARPAPSAAADPSASLTAHPLAYAPGPLDNPLKGFVPFYEPGKTYENKYPHSMEWSYFALSDLMRDFEVFDWAPLEKMLDEVAKRGRQSAIRVYIEYPGKASGLPEFLSKAGVKLRPVPQWKTQSPDYDDPRTIKALTNFIRAFGQKYDGDPRLGFVSMGLIGLWGEWHMWPADQLFPSDASVARYVDAFDSAFDKTKIEIRYARLAKGYVVKKNVGYHDDSFFFREQGKGVTLPRSLGGHDWSFLQEMLDFGAENRWIENSVGGEARPEIQRVLFNPQHKGVDDITACVELAHVTWLMNQRGINVYKRDDAGVATLVRRMGYELHVSEARFDDFKQSEALRVGVTIENRGVAPFYYPWRFAVAVADQNDKVVGSWYTSWDIRDIQPLSIRTFPDWKLAGDPKEIPFGAPRKLGFSLSKHGLSPGRYKLLLRVVHPLEASLPKRGGARPLPLRFANQSQRSNGWLLLGETTVKP